MGKSTMEDLENFHGKVISQLVEWPNDECTARQNHPVYHVYHRIHGAGIYANITGVYWWDPWSTIYSSTIEPMGVYHCQESGGIRFPMYMAGDTNHGQSHVQIVRYEPLRTSHYQPLLGYIYKNIPQNCEIWIIGISTIINNLNIPWFTMNHPQPSVRIPFFTSCGQ